jgi:TetR/AcrR family transcriptional repressor of lmrAB and yxaGH operons
VSNDSREKMVRSAASLIASRGLNATSFSDVVADSGAPRGSIYHHFPDGKEQLSEEAVRWVTERVLAHQRACPGTTATEVLNCFIGMWRRGRRGLEGRFGLRRGRRRDRHARPTTRT